MTPRDDETVEALFERWVEHHVLHGAELDPVELAGPRTDLTEALRRLIDGYRRVSAALEATVGGAPGSIGAPSGSGGLPEELPQFEGFRTIERIGAGGMGEVFKVQDLKLNRVAAAKILRADRTVVSGLRGFLNEARALALFQDPHIVSVYEFRDAATPPVIFMEYVDGFELGRVGPSLEFRQRARIVRDVCEAVHRAHRLGLQHRDLKPSNIVVDGELRPRILDFGLSTGDPAAGHFRGTPPYLAPEQLDPSKPIDARTDVYALGAVLYELLCGVPPFDAGDEDIVERIRTSAPRLPVEVVPDIPEPLQAIALKALERDPAARYATARDMALDLDRYLEGRPVSARPSHYASALGRRVTEQLDQVSEWLRLKLIYPHEASRLRAAYAQFDRRADDWIGESRTLSYSQIALYLGAFLLMCGSFFYFGAHRFYEAVTGVGRPFVVLGLPFIGLNLTAHFLERRDHRAVSVAFYLGGVSLLPLFLLIAFHETGLWVVAPESPGQFFQDGSVSNRQLQVTVLVACLWAGWLALRTRTIALSTVFSLLGLVLVLAVLTDAGLRGWFEEQQWDRLSLHLLPLVPTYVAAGYGLERSGRPWFGRPLYTGAALLFIVVMELLALDGRLFHYLGVTLQPLQSSSVSDPLLIDTLAAMSINGLVFYGAAGLADRYGTTTMSTGAWLLFTLSPFATLEPLAYLSETGEYARTVDWLFLGLALTTAVLSHQRQRKSFYYSGILNTGLALWFIADHHEWFDKPWWAVVLVIGGLIGLIVGFGLDARERRRAGPAA